MCKGANQRKIRTVLKEHGNRISQRIIIVKYDYSYAAHELCISAKYCLPAPKFITKFGSFSTFDFIMEIQGE
jgi:hypothetical protein